jgi:hypothetical protein
VGPFGGCGRGRRRMGGLGSVTSAQDVREVAMVAAGGGRICTAVAGKKKMEMGCSVDFFLFFLSLCVGGG